MNIRVLFVAGLVAMGVLAAPRAEAAAQQMPITFGGYTNRTEVLTNFPVLVVLSNNVGANFTFSNFVTTNGYDLRFYTNSTDTGSGLDYEIESWNTNSAAYVWVRLPLLMSNGTSSLIAKWGDTANSNQLACTTNGAVWTNGFAGVWHLDGTNGGAMDSSSNRYTGVLTGNVTTTGVAQIAGGYTFDGTADYVRVPLTNGATATISCWAKSTATGLLDMLWCIRGASPGPDLFFYNGKISLNSWNGDSNPFCTQPSPLSQMRHYVTVIDSAASQAVLYIDGVRAGTATYVSPAAGPFFISSGTDYDWEGVIDEFSVSRVARSSNWVWACYLNQASNSLFNNYGPMENVAVGGVGGGPGIQNLAVSGVATNLATFNGWLTSTGTSATAVYVLYGQDTNAWANTNAFTGVTWTNNSFPSTNITLTPNQQYYCTFGASNTASNVVAATPKYLITGEVTVEATDATAKYPGNAGEFTIRRPADLTNGALVVNYTLGGTAVGNVDYAALSGSVTLNAGVSNIAVTVTPLRVWNPDRQAILSLAPGAYAVGASGNAATVTVLTASTIYVATNGTHDVPHNFDTWAGAATNINEAVALANALGLSVSVSNGSYRLTNELMVATNITIQSVNGPGATTLYGNGGAFKLLTVSSANALVAGFTLTNGSWFGVNGAALDVSAGLVSNCVIARSTGGAGMGPVNVTGGRLASCVVSNISPTWGVLGVSGTGIMEDCTVTGNAGGDGPPVTLSGGVIRRCRIFQNSSKFRPGGVSIAGGRMENSLVYGNSGTADSLAGGVYLNGGAMVNCTIAGNSRPGGTASGVQRDNGVLTNCIVYGNGGGTPLENYNGAVSAAWYSCAPELTNSAQGNVTGNPGFVNAAQKDYHLLLGSPCLDTGTNLPGITQDFELRTRPLASDSRGNLRHDMGAYEKDGAAGPLALGFSGAPLSGMNSVTSVFTAVVAGSNTVIAGWGWDFNNDGTDDLGGAGLATVTNAFGPGRYSVAVRITNAVGEVAASTNVNYVLVVGADIHVATNGASSAPYATWATAATNLNDALDVALAGCSVHVSNGSYRIAKTLNLFSRIAVRSENGPNVTTVWRDAAAGDFGIFDLRDAGAWVSGFTLTNGYLGTAGSAINMSAGIVSNCVITKCKGAAGVGPVNVTGGRLTSCVISNNSPTYSVLGVSGTGIAEDTVFRGNSGFDGAPIALSGGVIRRCRIFANSSTFRPGGVSITGGRMENSLVYGNSAANTAGGVYLNGGAMINCTIAGNSKTGGTASGVQRDNGVMTNCIVYGNGANNPNDNYNGAAGAAWYCCAPEMTAGAQGNITDNPQFEGAATGNCHLVVGSPCVDKGTNVWSASDVDLDFSSRLRGAAVDMGAYEIDASALPFGVAFNVAPAAGVGAVTSVLSAVVSGSDTNVAWWGWDFNNNGDFERAGTDNMAVVTNTFGLGRHTVYLRATNASGQTASYTNANCVLVVAPDIYVSTNGGSVPPYSSWTDAATNLNDAVGIAQAGCAVHVSNGSYRITRTLNVFSRIAVRSENGPNVTTVWRDAAAGDFGIFDLRDAGAWVSGFTLTNGYLGTAGSAINMSAGIVSNCMITRCTGGAGVGPVNVTGGLLASCIISNNSPTYSALGVSGSGIAEDLEITATTAWAAEPVTLSGGVLRRCRILRNSSGCNGGGVSITGGRMENSLVYSNRAQTSQGSGRGGGVYLNGGTMVNCTVSGNSSSGADSGVVRTGGAITNCIVYGNGANSPNENYSGTVSAVWYSCAPELTAGVQGNITNNPLFMDVLAANYRLKDGSPCINAGTNWSGVLTALDLDGLPRVKEQTVDMGAYEGEAWRGTVFRFR